jgi:DNA repair exonuclease SbcCD nuclease subunit
MAKILLVGDLHLGARSDNQNFKTYFRKYCQEVLFPYLTENSIRFLIQVGDTFDRRKYINFHTLAEAYWFFDELEAMNVKYITILGNHDIYHKNTLSINSPELLLTKYPNVQVISKPVELDIDNRKMLFVPWICQENEKDVLKVIEESSAQFLVGHFEFQGFEMQRGVVCEHGTEASVASKFNMVFSGHFHHKSHIGNVLYLGTPYEITWNDFNDNKGMFALTEDNNLEFIPNHLSLFYKFEYDDSTLSAEQVNAIDWEIYRGTYIKLVVKEKNQPLLFDLVVEKLQEVEPADMQIIEEAISLQFDEEASLASEDTVTIINKVIDQIPNLGCEVNDLKRLMYDVYMAAQAVA